MSPFFEKESAGKLLRNYTQNIDTLEQVRLNSLSQIYLFEVQNI
jgi:NAD-dependent SIR2 family protein deacetylase